MDGFVSFLVFLGVMFLIGKASSKKKPQQKNAQPQQSPAQPVKPGTPQRVPFTKADWQKMIEQQREVVKQQTQEAPVIAGMPLEEGFSQETYSEGLFSTQGESEAEHAEHVQKLQEAEAQLQSEKAVLAELHRSGRDELRKAVVMSEVLGKPVSLRSRRVYR